MRSILLATHLALPALPALIVGSLLAVDGAAGPPSVPIPFLPPQSPPPSGAPRPKSADTSAPGNPADGTWQEFNLLQVSGALATYDAVQNRLLSFGGSRASNWALPLAPGCGCEWQPLPMPSSPVQPNRYRSAIDPVTGLVYTVGWEPYDLRVRTLDPATGKVTEVVPVVSHPQVHDFERVVAFDAAARRLIVISTSPYALNVWVLDLLPAPRWTQWDPAGTPPPFDYQPNMVLDPVRRRLLFPDPVPWRPDSLTFLTLDGPPEWRSLQTGGQLPAGGSPNPYVYDPVSDRIRTVDEQGQPYSLSLETLQWSRESIAGAGPPPRQNAGLAIDPARHRLILSGGDDVSLNSVLSDAWALDESGSWLQLVADSERPPVFYSASDAFDPGRNRLLLYLAAGFNVTADGVWSLDLSATPQWSFLATAPPRPPSGTWHAAAWDEGRDQLVVSGQSGPLGSFMDVWALSFAAGPVWTAIAPGGEAPPVRTDHSLVYDRARDRFLMLFGRGETGPVTDVWELRLGPSPTWRRLAVAGVAPTAPEGAMCVVDDKRGRLLLFGGAPYQADLWALDLEHGDGAWRRLPVPPGPTWRGGGLLRIDTVRDRLVLFGGIGPNPYGQSPFMNDTWALNLSGSPAWQRLLPAGVLPDGRLGAAGAYDARLDRLVVAGGQDSNDLFALGFGALPTSLRAADRTVTARLVRLTWVDAENGARFTAYRRASGRTPDSDWRSVGTVTADHKGQVTLEDRNITAGGSYDYRLGTLGGANESYTEAITVRVPAIALGLSLAARSEHGRAIFAFELPSGDPARLELFDLAGRSVWSRAVGSLGAGAHEISAEDATLPSALYFARLTQGAEVRFARVMVLR